LGLIKDLVISLSPIPSENLVMDVVVVNIPPQLDMLLSRSWAEKLKETLQMDIVDIMVVAGAISLHL